MKNFLEPDYLATQILFFLDIYQYSPNGYYAQKVLIRMLDGKEISLASAYRKLKDNINYVDDELLNKINSHACIMKKLKKDCNN